MLIWNLRAICTYAADSTLKARLTRIKRYNYLIIDCKQFDISEYYLKTLAQLFVQYSVQNMFGLYLIYSYFRIPFNTIIIDFMFRRKLSDYWTKSISFERDLSDIFYRHIFILSAENRFLLYEYRQDKLCKRVLETDYIFFQTLSSYLRAYKLTGILALEILEHTANSLLCMWEFVLEKQRTVQVHKDNRVAQTSIYRVTGWSFAQNKNNTISVKRHETYASIGNCGHRIFTDRKTISKIDNVLDLLLHEEKTNNGSRNRLLI